ncbi:MAG: hypothetical protein M1820_006938 [Bogoriella megaspora]|nr:MAG: hypothetical protein M1820_006938 [Bogoriella megaspora]
MSSLWLWTAATLAFTASAVPIIERYQERSVEGLTNLTVSSATMEGHDFPDPSVIYNKKDGHWYAYGTASGGSNLQVATSKDFVNWDLVTESDGSPYNGLKDVPSWVDPDNQGVWAPDINQLDDGTFVIYYAAQKANFTGGPGGEHSVHCIGMATSSKPTGPFEPDSDAPFLCDDERGGAIDPAGFRDDDGTRWLVYKVDGNNFGNGGSCNNEDGVQKTPIYLVQLDSDTGCAQVGDPVFLLQNEELDGPLVEAPSLGKSESGHYVLFFSSGCYSDPTYDTSYAISTTGIKGPYRKLGPLITSDSSQPPIEAPGGGDIAADGVHFVFHGGAVTVDGTSTRSMYTTTLDINSLTIDNDD